MRHRHRRMKTEVELNLASMLDMAFQLLAFFILMFRPAPIEGQLSLHLPPPTPLTDVAGASTEPAAGAEEAVSLDKILEVSLTSNADGTLGSARAGAALVFNGPGNDLNLARLDAALKARLTVKGAPYEEVLIRVAPALHYEELMKVIDVCAQQKTSNGQPLRKINFTDLPSATKLP